MRVLFGLLVACVLVATDAQEAPRIALASSDTTLFAGETTLLVCASFGETTEEISWWFNGVELTTASDSSMVITDAMVTDRGGLSFRHSVLQLCSVSMEDAGLYTCMASNNVTSGTYDILLTVNAFADNLNLVVFTEGTVLNIGETTLLACVRYGRSTEPATWTHSGASLRNSTRVVIYEETMSNSALSFTVSYLRVCSAEEEDSGVYTCTVRNDVASFSSTLQLSVTAVELVAVSTPTTAMLGESIFLYCVTYGPTTGRTAWTRDGMPLSNSTQVSIGEEIITQGATMFKLSFLRMCALDNSGNFACMVSNVNDSLSSTVPFYIDVPVVIVSSNTSVIMGDTAILSCVGYSQPGLQLSWWYRGELVTNSTFMVESQRDLMSGTRSFRVSFLQICAASLANAGDYTCLASNGQVSNTATVQLIIAEPIVTISSSTTVMEGETAILSCVGYGVSGVAIAWSRNGAPVINTTRITTYDETALQGAIPFKRSIVQICSARAEDSGGYVCTGTAGRAVDSWTVQFLAYTTAQVVAITPDLTLVEGNSAILACVGYSEPDLEVTWWYRGALVTNSSLVTTFHTDVVRGGLTFHRSFVQLCSVNFNNAGEYTCLVSNGATNATSTVQVAVTTSIVAKSADITLTDGETAVLSCVTNDFGDGVSIDWSGNGVDPTTNATQETVVAGTLQFTRSVLTLCSVEVMDTGPYVCTVTSGNNTVMGTIQMTVTPYAAVDVVAVSNTTSVIVGDTAIIACVSYGEMTQQTSWARNGTGLGNGTDLISFSEDFSNFTLRNMPFKVSFLEICSVQLEDASSYSCIISNRGAIVSATAELTVSTPVQLVVISADTTVEEGETAVLACVGYSEPYIEMEWWKDGVLVTSSTPRVTVYNETVFEDRPYLQSFLRVCSVDLGDAGGYTCVARNRQMSTSSTVQLNVQRSTAGVGLVAISNDTFLGEAQTAFMSCVGYGDPTAQITWRRANGALLGNSSRLTVFEQTRVVDGIMFKASIVQFCAVFLGDSDAYTCTVSNGRVSETATTQLIVALELVAISVDTTLMEQETTILSCVGFGHPNIDTTWTRNGQILTNSTKVVTFQQNAVYLGVSFNMSFLQLCNVSMEDAGGYTCVVSDGRVTTNGTVALTVTPSNQGVYLGVITDNTVLEEGHAALFSCVAYGPTDLTFSWFANGEPVMPELNGNVSVVDIVEEITLVHDLRFQQSFLQICSVDAFDGGTYTCSVTNGPGGVTFSADLELTVLGSTFGLDLGLISDDTTVGRGETAILTCVAFGAPYVEFTWLHNGHEELNTTRISMREQTIMNSALPFRVSSLQICSAQLNDIGTYTCVVTNGNLTFNATTQLSMTALDLVGITDDTSLSVGETLLLSCVAFGLPYVDITWTYNGMPVTTSAPRVSTYEEEITEVDRPFKQSFLRLCSVTMRDAGNYGCSVSNGIEMQDASTTVTVTEFQNIHLAIIANDSYIQEGQTTILSCVGYNYAMPTLQLSWTKDGNPFMNRTLAYSFNSDATYATRTFPATFIEICSVGMDDAGNYTCSVTDGTMTVTSTVELVVLPSTAGVQLGVISNDTTVSELDTVILACTGYGSPFAQLNWTRDGELIMGGSSIDSRVNITEETSTQLGLTFMTSYLQICTVGMADWGTYTCSLGNGRVMVDTSVDVTVTMTVLQLAGISADTTLMEGETVMLYCAGYSQHTATITWLRNGNVLPNISTAYSYQETIVADGVSFALGTLVLCSVAPSDTGTYTCMIDNTLRSVTGDVSLDVIGAAAFLDTPDQLLVSVDYGRNVSLTCNADGFPSPNIIWLKDGTVVVPSSKFVIQTVTRPGALRRGLNETVVSTLSVVNATTPDSGSYNCRAVNVLGTTELPAPFTLTVGPPPTSDFCTPNPCRNGGTCTSNFVTFECACTGRYFGTTCDMLAPAPTVPEFAEMPVGIFTPLLGSASLRCIATGFPQPTIQWYKDGFPQEGQTDSVLNFDEVSLSDRGFYYCTAMNSEGRITSDSVVVAVTNIRQYTIPVLTTLNGATDIRTALPDFVENLNTLAAGQPVTGDLGATVSIYQIGLSAPPVAVPNMPGLFRAEILVSFLNSTDVPDGNLIGVPEAVMQIQQVASDDLRVPDFNLQVDLATRFDGCNMEEEPIVTQGQARADSIDWTEVGIGITASKSCPCMRATISVQASRVCGGDFIDGGMWMDSSDSGTACDFGDVGLQLCSAQDIGTVDALTSDGENLNSVELTIVADIVQQALNLSDVNVIDDLITIIDNILHAPLSELQDSHENFNTTNRLRTLLHILTEAYPIEVTPQPIIRNMFGCSAYPSLDDDGIDFSASFGDQITLNGDGTSTISIELPGSVSDSLNGTVSPSVIFCTYRTQGLYLSREQYLMDSGNDDLVIGSNIASARLSGGIVVTSLTDPVVIVFMKTDTSTSGRAGCYIWDENADAGYGGWSAEGCVLVGETDSTVTCECYRLDDYIVLIDTTALQDNTIGRYTIIGAAVVLVCAIFVLISLLITKDVRGSLYGVILINFCIILILLYSVFIVTHFVYRIENACKAFAFLVHYFLLAACLGLSIISFFTCFNPLTGTKQKIVYIAGLILNWVLPAIIVVICIAAASENYYNSEDSTPFCRPVAEPYWYGLLLVGGILCVFTIVFVIFYPFNVKYVHSDTQKTRSIFPRLTDYIALIIITIFFYIAWGFGLPATRPLNMGSTRIIFEIIFIACSSVVGITMVLCYALLSDKVRAACCRNRPDPSARQVYGFSAANENVYMAGGTGKEDEIPFSDLDANTSPPDYDSLKDPDMGAPFYYADDVSVADEVGPDSKDELENVFTNMDGVDTLF